MSSTDPTRIGSFFHSDSIKKNGELLSFLLFKKFGKYRRNNYRSQIGKSGPRIGAYFRYNVGLPVDDQTDISGNKKNT
jgi:hypothetical protein